MVLSLEDLHEISTSWMSNLRPNIVNLGHATVRHAELQKTTVL